MALSCYCAQANPGKSKGRPDVGQVLFRIQDMRLPYRLSQTCAMIVLQATQDIRKSLLWLAYSNLITTEVYMRPDPSEMLDVIETILPPHL